MGYRQYEAGNPDFVLDASHQRIGVLSMHVSPTPWLIGPAVKATRIASQNFFVNSKVPKSLNALEASLAPSVAPIAPSRSNNGRRDGLAG